MKTGLPTHGWRNVRFNKLAGLLYTLCRRAVVATFDLSAANLHLLETDHWLSNRNNVLLLKLTQPAWHSTTAVVAAPRTDPRLVMAAWRASEVVAFAKAKDLAGPAAVIFASGMDGEDFLCADEAMLVKDVRLTPFAARKLLRAREAFLAGG